MWAPRTWEAVEALKGFASETPSLDFKRELGTPEDIAVDIATMTVNGGVLLYGVDEDKTTVTATAIMPVPRAGAEERLRNVAGSHISPVPDFEVYAIADPSDATRGVLAVVIPASGLAPHQANGRYPCRRGTVRGYLEEREVERLYAQRRDLAQGGPPSGLLVGTEFVSVLNGFEVREGTGRLRLAISPASGSVVHPAGAWQAEPLGDAVTASLEHQHPRLANGGLVRGWAALSRWAPMGTEGWSATNAGTGTGAVAPIEKPAIVVGACLSYPATFTFEALLGLSANPSGRHEYRSAREADIVRELVVMLSTAGEYFREVSGGGLLRAELALDGFAQAKSQFALERMDQGMVDLNSRALPAAPDALRSSAPTSSAELRETPERVVRALIERWLPSFYSDERDLIEWVVPNTSE